MKKIGLLTYSNSNNYGAVLQIYALQKSLQLISSNVFEVIDYYPLFMNGRYDPFIWKPFSIKRVLWGICHYPETKRKWLRYKRFRARYLLQSHKKYINVKPDDNYDAYIVGSDQVWNFELNQHDTTYILDFVDDKKKKFSFAASIASNEFMKCEDIYKKYLPSFSYVSVREPNHFDFCKAINERTRTDMDSVFLIRKAEWDSFVTDNKHGKYIFLYFFRFISREFANQIIEYAETNNCKIISIGIFPIKSRRIFVDRSCGPIQFLNYIAHAEYIFTDSFHGTAFSIIFQKPFYSVKYPDTFSRTNNLTSSFRLEDRVIDGENVIKDFVPIDYSEKEIIFENIRRQSIGYLREVVRCVDE